MATHDYIISNASGAAVRSDLNNALSAIVSNNSSATEPATTYAYQMWADTGSTPAVMKLRDSTNSSWITLYNLDGSSLPIASATEIVFNDAGADLDFRIEGDTEANLFYVDAGNDRIGIGVDSPSELLDLRSTGTTRIFFESNDGGSPEYRATVGVDSEGFKIQTRDGAFGNNTDRLTIDTSGNVGIGTTSPNFNLSVKGAADSLMEVQSSSNNRIIVSSNTAGNNRIYARNGSNSYGDLEFWSGTDRETMRIDGSGRLLVNTTTARAGYFNSSSTYGGKFLLEGANSNLARVFSFVYGDASANDPVLLLAKHRSTSTGVATSSLTSVNDGDALGMISFQGKTGDKFVEGARIQAEVNGTPGANDLPTDLRFRTTADGDSGTTERMRIFPDGSVVLGAINGTASSIDTNSRIFYYSNEASTSGSLFIDSRNSGGFVQINQSYGDNGNRGAVEFYRNESYKGQISVSSTQVYYNTTSDYRLKENVANVTGGIDLVKQLQPRSFNFIDEPGETIMGFVAHEVQDVVPNAVSGTKDGLKIWEEGEELPDGLSVGDNKLDENGDTIPDYQCLDQAKLVPVLTAALKEAIAKIETLEAKVAALESA